MFLLFISLLSLFFGLFLAPKLLGISNALSFFDGFVSIFVGDLVLFHIFPHSFSDIGMWALPLFFLGVVIPIYLEKRERQGLFSLVLLGVGFSIHAFLDGVGLYMDNVVSHMDTSHVGHHHDQEHASSTVVWAVLAHRIPVGLYLGFASLRSPKIAYFLAVLISLATVFGFFIGSSIPWVGAIQALIGGALLHVISGHRLVNPHMPENWPVRIAGVLTAGIVLFVMSDLHLESLFLEMWSLASLLFLAFMAVQLPKHECISCDEAEIPSR